MSRPEKEVVISGIGGLFPKSADVEQLGENILANEFLVHRFENLWGIHQYDNLEPIGGRMPDYDRFDDTFFGMHQKLSLWADPNAKLGFERSFEAILDAGINPLTLRGSNTYVFAGQHFSDYEIRSIDYMRHSNGYTILGHSRAMNANRISYYFDFSGRSTTYDCSDAFGHFAVSMACEAIRRGDCEDALIVASTAVFSPMMTLMYESLGLLSKDAGCHPFENGAAGSGMHRGDSCIAFLLQSAEKAKRCYATVLASDASFVGGGVRFDPTLPNPAGIAAFLRDLYRSNGVDPRRVAYLEGDGMGHPLLDAVELDVADRVLGVGRSPEHPLLVGSIKGNAGHTETASGMLGMVKAIIAMEKGVVPATVNLARDGARIIPDVRALAEGRLKVVTENTPLPLDADSVVSVNTQTIYGLNGHTVLRPNTRVKAAVDASKELPRLVIVSARSEDHALTVARKVRSYPFDPEYLRLVQDALGSTIRGYEHRSFVICPPEANEPVTASRVEKRDVWFVYSGMGSQWAGMGSALMDLPLFRDTIERLHAVLLDKGLDLKAILTETGPTAFDNIMKSFVGITACQIALTNILTAIGLVPHGIVGHSVGELGCAYADGCLTETQTILAAYARGKASNDAELIKGMMAAVGLGYQEVVERLPPTIDVACRNSASSCTLSGPADDVQAFVRTLTAEGVFARAVNVADIAYHSRYIQPAAPFLLRYLEEVIPDPKRRSEKWVSSSVPAHLVDTPAAQYCSAEYQTNNLLNPVLFEDALRSVPKDAVMVEIAPHGLLQAILKRARPGNAHIPLTQRDHPQPVRMLLNALGRISYCGPDLDVAKLYPEVHFPVSRGTPPVSPLATWMHEEVHYIAFHKINQKQPAFSKFQVFTDSPHMSVCGHISISPSECMETAWCALGRFRNQKIDDIPVVFRDVSVCAGQELPFDGALEVSATASRATGLFEVEGTDGLTLLQGYVFAQDRDALPPMREPSQKASETVTGDEVLADLAARGLVYSDKYRHALKSIVVLDEEWLVKIDTTGTWSTFLEALIQVLQYHASGEEQTLVLLHTIKRLEVDPIKIKGQTEIAVRFNLAARVLQGEGLYGMGFTFSREKVRAATAKSPLKLVFMPYGELRPQQSEEFLSLVAQLALEQRLSPAGSNSSTPTITILEMQNCAKRSDLGWEVRNFLQTKMGIEGAVKTVSVAPDRVLSVPEAGCSDEVFLTVSLASTMAEGARVAALVGGYLLVRSPARLADQGDVRVVAEQRVDGADWLSLLRPARPAADPAGSCRVVQMVGNQPPPAKIADAGPDNPVVLVWQGLPERGVTSAIDEVRRRPYAPHARMVFILDEHAPRFALDEPLYAAQLRLQLQVNILRDGRWGCWLTLPTPGVLPAALAVKNLEGIEIEALGLNPRAHSISPGKMSWSGHLDYVGSAGATRWMGVARWNGDTRRPRPDPLLRWTVPDHWSATEAATVPYAYASAYYALLFKGVSGIISAKYTSILVQEGTSAFGQAAIRVARTLGFKTIYTTVANQAQRQLLHEVFPELEPSHVLSCADTSFETRIRVLTKGRGVKLVINRLPGEMVGASLRCVAAKGTYLHLGREDMEARSTIGMYFALGSISICGLPGDELFVGSESRRRDLLQLAAAMERGIADGVVQPIRGARCTGATTLDALERALRVRENGDAYKVVMAIQKTADQHENKLNAKMSYVVAGGEQHEWLQVASWLAQHGARELLVASGPVASPSLLRHRQRTLRRLYAANLRVEEVRSWDSEAAAAVLRSASLVGPVDAVVVLDKVGGRPGPAALLHGAMSGQNALRDAALVVLAGDAPSACRLTALCEARLDAGQRVACMAGPLEATVSHLADLLRGALPAVTLLPGHGPDGPDGPQDRDVYTAVPCGMPTGAARLAELGRRGARRARGSLHEFMTQGLRLRHTREALPVFAVAPLGALEARDEAHLTSLGARLGGPLVAVLTEAYADLGRQAEAVADTILAARPSGPYNLLGWGLGTPLALQVARRLEDAGHRAVTFLVDGDVRCVQRWASEQTARSVLKALFPDDDEVLDARGDALPHLLSRVPAEQRPLVESGLRAVRCAVTALARHVPNVGDPVRGRLIDIQRENTKRSFTRGGPVELRTLPLDESAASLGGAWIAEVINEWCGFSKEVENAEMRPVLDALKAAHAEHVHRSPTQTPLHVVQPLAG